jgi:CheY-like chemotaxis protein
VEFVQVRAPADALEELGRSPCQALVVNNIHFQDQNEALAQLNDLPFGAALIECWVPGDDPSHLDGVLRYLAKPVKRADLLWSLEQLGPSTRTVLIVDDQPEILQLFARMLASAEREYSVIRARNGRHALDLLRSRRPDVMLLDLLMPEFDGFEVLREKNADPEIRDIPVIVISANDPAGTPIISDHLSFWRSSGFSAREFLDSIQAVSEVLAPRAQPDGQVQPVDFDA